MKTISGKVYSVGCSAFNSAGCDEYLQGRYESSMNLAKLYSNSPHTDCHYQGQLELLPSKRKLNSLKISC